MLRGELVGLRSRIESDVAVLHCELYDDEATWVLAHSEPWRPIDIASEPSPYTISTEPNPRLELFTVVALGTGELVGEALLWGIDGYNRVAHLGLSMFASCRGKGYGVDVVRILCRHGFDDLDLHRLQIDTLASNAPMRAAAIKAGFVLEGTTRGSAWLAGEFVDEVVLGLLAAEWRE